MLDDLDDEFQLEIQRRWQLSQMKNIKELSLLFVFFHLFTISFISSFVENFQGLKSSQDG